MIVTVMDMGKICLAMLTRAGMIAHGSGAIAVGVVGGHGDGKTTVRGASASGSSGSKGKGKKGKQDQYSGVYVRGGYVAPDQTFYK